jgi:hypothetical protein
MATPTRAVSASMFASAPACALASARRGPTRGARATRRSIGNPTRERTSGAEFNDEDDDGDGEGSQMTMSVSRIETFLSRQGRHATFEATKRASLRVHQRADGRSVRAYMSLPASQYSTLDGESVERVDDDTFKVELSAFNFLGFTLKPSLVAKVYVREDGSGCEVRVEDMTLSGSGVVERTSDAFEIVSVNNVTWGDVDASVLNAREREVLEKIGGEYKEMTSETRVSVYLLVPRWFPFTIKSTERTGRFVVNQVVNQVVPRFLAQLSSDYDTWARGNDSRAATGGGMCDVTIDENCEAPQ